MKKSNKISLILYASLFSMAATLIQTIWLRNAMEEIKYEIIKMNRDNH